MVNLSRFVTLGVLVSLFTVSLGAKFVSKSYATIATSVSGFVLRATFNNPPINLYDSKLAGDLFALVQSLENQTDIKVVVLASANPNFWIAHEDIHLLSAKQPPSPPVNVTEASAMLLSTLESVATLPVVFIAEINGRASLAGDELALRCDIRYAGPGTRLSQFEVGFNLLPGAGGIEYLIALIGRARALEYILSGRSVDAETAAAIGWVNRAFSSPKQLRTEVDALAHRIASFSEPALAAIKQRINAESKPSTQSVQKDLTLFVQLNGLPAAQAAVDRYLKLSENQKGNAFELNLPNNLEQLNG